MLSQVQVGAPSNSPDGANPVMLGGRAGEGIVSELHGKYYTQTYRGAMYMATTTTASAIPIANTTAPTFVLWNPAGSGKNAVLVRYAAGWVATTEAPGNIEFALLTSAGAGSLATGAPFSAFTAAAAQSGLLGSGSKSGMLFGTAATLTTAGTVIATSGLSHLTTTGTATSGSFSYIVDFDGMMILPPGNALYTVASAATASTYNQSLFWYEAAQ